MRKASTLNLTRVVTHSGRSSVPQLIPRIWPADPDAFGPRRGRQAARYEAYVPDPIAGLDIALPLDVANDVAMAERAISELQAGRQMIGLEALGRHLLRAESVASSKIEGLAISQRKLALALLAPAAADAQAREVVANVNAMQTAIEIGAAHDRLGLQEIKEIHRVLFEGIHDDAGQLRQTQNWIGGNDYGPIGADFIPPPEDTVERLLIDLGEFNQRTDLPAIVQASVAHAQFQTIHPFADGNGRTGRALVHAILRRRSLSTQFVPPISLVLATNGRRYVEGLGAYRSDGILNWIAFFARAAHDAADHSRRLARDLAELQAQWRTKVSARQGSTADRLLEHLPALPVVDARAVAAMLRVSEVAARMALNRLETLQVLRPVIFGRLRNRAWESPDLLSLLDQFEWDVATPTNPQEPRRMSPQRHR